MRRLPSRSLLMLPVLAIAFGTPAFADLWYESYKKGEDALNQRNWKEAIDQFTQAIEKKGEPGVQVRTYGMNFINYHPYLKLGIAYYNLGQIDAALQAFAFLGGGARQTAFFAAPMSSGNEMVVGLSRLGAGNGIGGSGELCTLDFTVVGPGAAGLAFARAHVRDSANRIVPAAFEPALVTAR